MHGWCVCAVQKYASAISKARDRLRLRVATQSEDESEYETDADLQRINMKRGEVAFHSAILEAILLLGENFAPRYATRSTHSFILRLATCTVRCRGAMQVVAFARHIGAEVQWHSTCDQRVVTAHVMLGNIDIGSLFGT